jgi:hypothetical protein
MKAPNAVRKLLILAMLTVVALVLFAGSCDTASEIQREASIEARTNSFAAAEAAAPAPRTVNFPIRKVLVEYTRRGDLSNHPWYTYIMNDLNAVTHYFVSTALPVNSCAFLSSTEDVYDDGTGNLVLTAPSLDGIYYGGSGASASCNGWIFIDAATGTMGLTFGTKIMTFDSPLVLETEPVLIRIAEAEPAGG